MAAGRIVLASIGVHAVALVAIARWLERPALVLAPPAEEQHRPIEVAIVPPPIEVAVIDDATGDAAPVASAAAPLGHAIASHAPRGGERAAATGSQPAGAHGAEHGPSPFMKMRGPDLVPDRGAMEGIVERGHNELPAPVNKTGRLEERPGGRAVIEDRVTTVRVERDGTAHLDDEPDIDVKVQFPIRPWAWRSDLTSIGHSLAEWAEDPMAGTRYGRTQDLPRHLQAVEGGCNSTGDLMCDDPMAPGAQEEAKRMPKQDGDHVFVPILSGKIDMTSYLAKKFGVGDVYASRKLALLDATRDERAARGDVYRTQQLARSAELMRHNLEALWASAATPAERREVLFELWDECAEGDGPIGEAGERARAEVLGWIASHHVAYSAGELAAFDKRRASKAAFAPTSSP